MTHSDPTPASRWSLAAFALATFSATALAQGEVQPRELAVLAPPDIAGVYPAGSADFDRLVPPPEGVAGPLVHVEDTGDPAVGADGGEACGAITNAEALDGAVAFIRRGGCDFCGKVAMVNLSTDAVAVAIYNDERVPDDDTTVFDMLDGFCVDIHIPSVFVSRATGLLLLDAMATDPVTVRLQPATPTDAEDGGEGAPERPAVSLAAHPNPVGGRATVRFVLAEASDIRLGLYDVLGREAAVLAEGPRRAGRHEVRLDAASLPAGLYVLRLRAGDDVLSYRVTLVR